MTIRKAMPFFWKYLMVVATSCVLAFIISNESHAQEVKPATTAIAKSVSADANSYGMPGKYAVSTIDQQWRDAARERMIPVRVIAPKDIAPKDVAATDRFPVIIFSHGLGGSKTGGKYWGEHWASHGYIVVHLQHLGSDESIWRDKKAADVASSLKGAMTMTNLGLRVGDVQFAIDEINKRSKDKEGVFANADASKIGMSGHSFGAQTTLALAGQASPAVRGQTGFDKRITAAIALSPNARNKTNLDKQFGDIRMPFFSITGSKDGAVLDDGTEVAHRMMPYQNMPSGNKFLAVFEGGDHMVFGGQTLGIRRPQTARDGEIQADVKAATLAFWDNYLKGQQAALQWLKDSQAGFKSMLSINDVFEYK
jgi:predicted dienelactone hydrolase